MDLLNFLIGSAYAADTVATSTASNPPPSSGFPLILMVGVFILYMYFVVLRPQSKRAKEQRKLLTGLAKGDEVMTAGGILGKIVKINENYVVLSLNENVEITLQKSAIATALPKGTLKSI